MDILFKDALRLKGPDAFQVVLKPAGSTCNLNCTYCYYLEKINLYTDTKNLKMSDEVLELFIKDFINAHNVPVVNFTWQGGEPVLMGLDFFRKAIELQKRYAGDKKIENSFQTNGTLLNEDWCQFFADNNMLVGISVDGEEHVHDHYRKTKTGKSSFIDVMHGIELLHKYKVNFNTLSTVNDYSANYSIETYRFLRNIGSGFMQFLPVVERTLNNTDESRLKLVDQSFNEEAGVTEWSVSSKSYGKFLISIFDEWVRNDVGKYYVQIFDATLANWYGEMSGLCVFSETCGDAFAMEHNGDIFSCDHFVYPEYFLGNLKEKTLSEIIRSEFQFNFGIGKRDSLPQYCKVCDVRFACHGECPKHRFIKAPDGETGLNYLCEAYRMFFRHVEPFMDFMVNELNNKRAPANVMNWIRNRENQASKPAIPERNDQCPCGSGKKFKNCCAIKPPYVNLN